MKLVQIVAVLLVSAVQTWAATAPMCVQKAGKPPTCQCDPGFHAECVPNPPPTSTPTVKPTATRTATAAPTATRTATTAPSPSPSSTPAPTATSAPGGALTLTTQGSPSTGEWAVEATTSSQGVYAVFFIDGARTDEWARPFCSFGDDGGSCYQKGIGAGSHTVDVELRDASNNALLDKKSQTVVEGGGIPIPTTAPTLGPTAIPTVIPTVGPSATPAPTVPAGAGEPTPPELPRALPNVTIPAVTGVDRIVNAGQSLQAALDAANPGDAVTIQAGAVFNTNIVLKKKAVTMTAWEEIKSWFGAQAVPQQIWIRSSAWQQLPPQGTRVTPADASKMPKIVGQGSESALRWDFGASNWYVTGLDLTNNNATTTYTNYSIATIGMDINGYSPPTEADLPDNIVFDRMYIHGVPTGNTRRGVTFNGGSFAISDSWIEDIHEVGADNQALGTWTAKGPVLAKNNYLNSCGEVFMSGGADTKIPNLVPSDITLVGNTIEWKTAWKTSGGWSCKNLTELKNARRVLIEKNLYRHWWPAGQSFAFAWTVRNQSGTNPWAEVNDVTFRNNRIEDIENGANTLAHDSPGSGGGVSTRMARFAQTNNLWIFSKNGTPRQFLAGAQDTLVEHETWVQPGGGGHINLSGSPAGNPAASELMVRFVFRDNIAYLGYYGIVGDNDGYGTAALNKYAPGWVYTNNGIYGPSPTGGGVSFSYVPPGNFFPADINAVGFVNMAGGDYRLAPNSPLKGKAHDGKDVGVADWTALPASQFVPPPVALSAPVEKGIIGKPEER